jgi:perosamine synthetase
MKKFIPISMPSITEKEKQYVNEAVESTWISSLGKFIDQFEKEFADFSDTKYAVAVSNGTAAIHLSLVAMGVKSGDEVIVPDLSFIATANAVLHANAKPVFVDIDPYNLCMDPAKIEAAITDKTKAIMPVHLYGHPADMIAINQIAEKYNLLVIEDAAEAHGAKINGKTVGSWGHCGTFSFYGNKNLTTGEGGMITTDDEDLYNKLRFLRDHAMSKEKRYWHTEPGYNYRMTNLQAALGCAQLERAEELMEKRQQIFKWYKEALEGVDGITLNRTNDWATNSYWLVAVEFEGFDENLRDAFMRDLKEEGVDSRPFFYPMSDMPYFEQANTPITHKVYQQGINLPTFFDLEEQDVAHICKSLIKINEKSYKRLNQFS